MILATAFLALTGLMTLLLIYIGFYAINRSVVQPQQGTKAKVILISGLLLWQVYLYIMAESGILADFSLPPRLPLLIIIPLFTFSGVFIYRNRTKNWVQHIPPSWLVYFQSFRIVVEILLYWSMTYGILPALVTFEGYNFDIVFGALALIIGFLVFAKKLLPLKSIIYWNYLGLFVLATVIFVFVSGTYFPGFYGKTESILTPRFLEYPYILLAGFLMPSAVFIHLLSIVQLKNRVHEN